MTVSKSLGVISALVVCAGAAMAQPANNACGSAQNVSLSALSFTTVVGTTVAATADGGTGNCGSSDSTGDVWYTVTAPSDGVLTADTCTAAGYDTVVSIRSGAACPGASLACDDDACGASRSTVSVNVTGGVMYRIRVSGWNGSVGTFTLRLTHGAPVPPPSPTIGPDVVVNQITDVARWGTNAGGTITSYSVGTDSCNPGDYPVLWVDSSAYEPDFNTTQHPVIGQNMYRLKSYGAYSRFEHLGQSWLKHGFVSTNSFECGTCTTGNPNAEKIWRYSIQSWQDVGGDVLGLNCSDTYGSGLNGSQGGLGAKNIVNAATGFSPHVEGNSTGDSTTRARLQVPTSDVTSQPEGTRYFVEGHYVTQDDAQFVRPGETVAFNALNNASWREVSEASINSGPTFVGSTVQQQVGLFAWKAADASVTLVSADHDDTPNPCTGYKDPITNGPQYPPGTKFIRSRFWIGAKATDLGGGQWRYEYAVHNLNSDRGASSFNLAFADALATPTAVAFHAPQWHSGEPYSNTPWDMTKAGGTLSFSTSQAYNAGSDTANAMRWGQLFNFGFTCDRAPVTGNATIGLFKPGTVPSITVAGIPVPSQPAPACVADFDDGTGTGTPDGGVTIDDLIYYLGLFEAGDANADVDDGTGTGTPDLGVTIDDLIYYLTRFEAGC